MATSTYLSNPVVLIGATSAATTDITDQVSAVTVNYVVEALEDTAFGSTARTNTAGLQSNSATLTLYASFASSESYATLSVLVGTKCYIKVTPASGGNTATNPGFELTNIELMGGAYTVDVT